ncbi:MAG TPA: DNA methyltransferase [Nitrososphaerales archaeon]|nr:DNA methyltransferase [Nitrososphaerales archaeon]
MKIENFSGDYPRASQRYFLRFAYSEASLAELACVKDRDFFDFDILGYDETGALIQCPDTVASSLILRLGGSYKISRALSDNLEESLENLLLPEKSKFNWTVSCYNCTEERLESSKEELRAHLKKNDLGKANYIDPLDRGPSIPARARSEKSMNENEEPVEFVWELKAREILDRILTHKEIQKAGQVNGIDFVVHGGLRYGRSKSPFFGYTTNLSDVVGFEKRDFARPFQDPTITIGPRLARMVVNCAVSRGSRVFLDPFCGLGTIMQEAILVGLNVIGIDRDRDVLSKARSNIDWLRDVYKSKRQSVFFRGDARRINDSTARDVDCIGTEPILLPRYKENPSQHAASVDIARAADFYASSLTSMASVLKKRDSHIAIISPTIVDSSGRAHTLDLLDSATRAGLKYYAFHEFQGLLNFPLRVDTSKKKMVQRNLNIFSLA